MTQKCHICGSTVTTNGAATGDAVEGFECADCGSPTCRDCKSIGVARETDHCQRCRG